MPDPVQELRELVERLIERCDLGFQEISARFTKLEESLSANTAGVAMNTAAFEAVSDDLVKHTAIIQNHTAELQGHTATMRTLADGMLRLENDLARTRDSVAQQIDHAVEKKVDDVVPFAVLAQRANGTEPR